MKLLKSTKTLFGLIGLCAMLVMSLANAEVISANPGDANSYAMTANPDLVTTSSYMMTVNPGDANSYAMTANPGTVFGFIMLLVLGIALVLFAKSWKLNYNSARTNIALGMTFARTWIASAQTAFEFTGLARRSWKKTDYKFQASTA